MIWLWYLTCKMSYFYFELVWFQCTQIETMYVVVYSGKFKKNHKHLSIKKPLCKLMEESCWTKDDNEKLSWRLLMILLDSTTRKMMYIFHVLNIFDITKILYIMMVTRIYSIINWLLIINFSHNNFFCILHAVAITKS